MVFIGLVLSSLLVFWVTVNIFKLNSIIACMTVPLIIGIVVMAFRKDFILPSLINGILTTIISIIMFQVLLLIYTEIFINHWLLNRLSDIFLFNIPIEELFFAFTVGFGLGHLYEFTFGYSEVPIKK